MHTYIKDQLMLFFAQKLGLELAGSSGARVSALERKARRVGAAAAAASGSSEPRLRLSWMPQVGAK